MPWVRSLAVELTMVFVEVHGLTSKPELNGKTGQVVGFDAHKGRYAVLVQGGQGLGSTPMSPMVVSLQGGNCILKTGILNCTVRCGKSGGCRKP